MCAAGGAAAALRLGGASLRRLSLVHSVLNSQRKNCTLALQDRFLALGFSRPSLGASRQKVQKASGFSMTGPSSSSRGSERPEASSGLDDRWTDASTGVAHDTSSSSSAADDASGASRTAEAETRRRVPGAHAVPRQQEEQEEESCAGDCGPQAAALEEDSGGSARAPVREQTRARIAVIGDVHGSWDPYRDILALKFLQPDIIIFVGDFGEEDVALVEQVAHVRGAVPGADVAVILGNHDAWYSLHRRRDARSSSSGDSSSSARGARVDEQLQLLGACHVGYRRLDFPRLRLSLLGARPFSYGPTTFAADFYTSRYAVGSLEESARRIVEAAWEGQGCELAQRHSFIVVGHNGPSGLGAQEEDICGRDFRLRGAPPGADFGDQDLAAALLALKASGVHVPLCIFGHMHHRVNSGALRKMLALGTPLVHPEPVAANIARGLLHREREGPSEGASGGPRQPRGAIGAPDWPGGGDRDGSGAGSVPGSAQDSAARAASASLAALSLKPCTTARGSQAGEEVGSQAGGQAVQVAAREAGGYAEGTPMGQGPRPTVHVNAAVVPRIRLSPRQCASCVGGGSEGALGPLEERHRKCTEHHFGVIELECQTGMVDFVDDVWVEVGACAGAARAAGAPAVCQDGEVAAECCRERRFQLGQIQENEGRVFSAG